MNRIFLCVALVLIFAVGLSCAHISRAVQACGACGREGEHGSSKSGGHTAQAKAEVKSEKTEAIKDPVCNREVSDIKKAPSEKYKGTVYYFCSKKCEKDFKKDPAPYTCGCAARMKGCNCGHCKGKDDTCPCLSEEGEGKPHEHAGIEGHEAKGGEGHKHD